MTAILPPPSTLTFQLDKALENPLSHISISPLQALIVILNYHSARLTIDCLHSLVPEIAQNKDLHVVVADNASSDNSVPELAAEIARQGWDWVTLLPLPRNGGFAYGNNAPIRWALSLPQPPDYFLLLNPDTVARPGAISALLDFMETHPQAGIAGSRLEDPDGTPQCSAFRFHTVWSELEAMLRLGFVTRLLDRWKVAPPISDHPCPADWVAGASMIIRQQVVTEVGLMDENYFMYYEETDFCLQAARAGWPCWYVPASHVVHLVGQSSGVNDRKQAPRRLPSYVFESRRRYFLKNCGWHQMFLVDLFWVVGLLIWRGSCWLRRKPNPDPPYLLLDFLHYGVWRPSRSQWQRFWQRLGRGKGLGQGLV